MCTERYAGSHTNSAPAAGALAESAAAAGGRAAVLAVTIGEVRMGMGRGTLANK